MTTAAPTATAREGERRHSVPAVHPRGAISAARADEEN